MKKTYSQKGFTLIEVVIVIGIIGILASIVVGSVTNARDKGADSKIESNLGSMKTQAVLIYSENGCYAGSTAPESECAEEAVAAAACPTTGAAGTLFAEPSIANQIASAKQISKGLTSCASTANQTAWAAAIQLKSDPSKAWCVDSKGAAKEINTGDEAPYTQTTLNADIAGAVCGS